MTTNREELYPSMDERDYYFSIQTTQPSQDVGFATGIENVTSFWS
jgi:hypothetical protein